MSIISRVLGFAKIHLEVLKPMLLSILPSLFKATWRPNGVFLAEAKMRDVEYVS